MTPTLTPTPDQTNPMALLLSLSVLPDGAEAGLAGGLRPEAGAFEGLLQTVLSEPAEARHETSDPARETGARPDPSDQPEEVSPTPEMPAAELTLWLGDLSRGAVPSLSVMAPAGGQGAGVASDPEARLSVAQMPAPSPPLHAGAALPPSGGPGLAAVLAEPPLPAQSLGPSPVEAKAQAMAEARPLGADSGSSFDERGLGIGAEARPQGLTPALKSEPGPTPLPVSVPLPSAFAGSGVFPRLAAPGLPLAAQHPSAPTPPAPTALQEMAASQPMAEGKVKPRLMARDLPVDFRVIRDTVVRPHVPEAATARPPMPPAELREAGGAITAILGQTGEARPVGDAPAEPQASPLAPGQPERLETENPEWIADLADRILAKLTEDGATIELALTPERLGPLEVRLELRDSRAEVSFRTETAEAARLLNEAQPRLADLMAQSGFNLAGQDTAPRDAPWRLRRDAGAPATPEAPTGPEAPSPPGYGHSGQLNLIA